MYFTEQRQQGLQVLCCCCADTRSLCTAAVIVHCSISCRVELLLHHSTQALICNSSRAPSPVPVMLDHRTDSKQNPMHFGKEGTFFSCLFLSLPFVPLCTHTHTHTHTHMPFCWDTPTNHYVLAQAHVLHPGALPPVCSQQTSAPADRQPGRERIQARDGGLWLREDPEHAHSLVLHTVRRVVSFYVVRGCSCGGGEGG